LHLQAVEMKRIARKSDGRRIFTAEFKHEQISRVLRGELSLADLSKELGIARSLLQRWKRLEADSSTPVKGAATRRATVPARTQDLAYIRELQLLVGKQTMELEFLRAELDALRKGRGPRRPSRR
jgi:transposase-like protein